MAGSMNITAVGASLGACLLLLAGPVLPVAAQDDGAARPASARVLFEEGVAFADKNQWQDASDRFQRALALRPSPVIMYNLASALEQLGRLVEASELLRRIPGDEQADDELRAAAQISLSEIAPRIARITLHAEGMQSGDRIAIDKSELLDAQLDVAVPIDPGPHVLSARRGKETLATKDVVLAEGQALEVTLQLVRAPSPREVAAAAPSTQDPTDRTQAGDEALTGQVWFWASVGAVAVGVVVAVLLASASGGGSDAAREPVAGDFDPPVVGVRVAP